ncbi:MAG: PDZ domain-containing protein [Planctomycetes bacterium]|nr:PDZ domain-containing protein [Planctomycetota bacterium]
MKSPAKGALLPLLLLPLCASQLEAQRFASTSQGEAVRRAWSSVVQPLRDAVVTVEVDETERALGTAVAADLVVTKYSELRLEEFLPESQPGLRCVLGERPLACQLVGFDRASDLALLRVPEPVLRPLTWRDATPQVGAFLASPDGGALPRGVGVLSAAPYPHTRQRAFLGVRFADGGGGEARIAEAVANGAARAAGLLDGDLVVRFAGAAVQSAQDLRDLIGKHQPGDRVELVVRRGEEDKTFAAVLGSNNSPAPSDQEAIWGPLSDVRSGFQQVLQHDTVLEPRDMGGPVIGLDGKALGVNIARAGRVETLALPAAAVRAVVAKLLGEATPNAR